jgi:hypothetical protein
MCHSNLECSLVFASGMVGTLSELCNSSAHTSQQIFVDLGMLDDLCPFETGKEGCS